MAAFLKVIGKGDDPCPEPYTEPYADFPPSRPPTRVHIGDYLILYAAGGRKCVFALARVTSEGHASDYADWPHRVDIEYINRVHPADGVPARDVSATRDLTMSIRQQTCVRLEPEEFERAKVMLEEAEKKANED